MRQQMAAGYAGKNIQGLEATVDQRWISSLGTTTSFEIARRLQFFTIDTITHICFGKPLGFVDSDSDQFNFIATIEQQLPIVQHFSVILRLNTLLRWISDIPIFRWMVVPSSADNTGIGLIMGQKLTQDSQLSRDVIHERLKSPELQKHDMLGSFMKRGLNPEQAEMEISITLLVHPHQDVRYAQIYLHDFKGCWLRYHCHGTTCNFAGHHLDTNCISSLN
ncbi:pisatin demethylase protein [Rutstroemia sp. NJR-2017a BBW]|nr:pisatin demethylase protein [Rutstroemia sp. NJR-2017a BBW]